jgi:hypothetical protein
MSSRLQVVAAVFVMVLAAAFSGCSSAQDRTPSGDFHVTVAVPFGQRD